MDQAYETVIGLEVHVELKTKSKIFCPCPTGFGGAPNTQVCPICLGMPGTLPVLNREVVRMAVKAGLATGCEITRRGRQDRKNYFYPDLPKAYQISQYDQPICRNGHLDIEADGGAKRIGITRIHIEEDAGKLVHAPGRGTLVDYNRGGTALIEIVSEPDLRSAREVSAYLQKLRAILIYIGVSDCKMNEGTMRCDVNLSVRPRGETKLGVRAELKNLNSFQFITKAIAFEANRQIEAIQAGETLVQETRRYDADTGRTHSMRKKEDAHDYRYFPDPDLMPIEISEEMLAAWQEEIPQLPDERKRLYMERYGLGAYDAEQLVNERAVADFFEAAVAQGADAKLCANLITSEIFRRLPPEEAPIPIRPAHMASLTALMASGRINMGIARKLLAQMWENDRDPAALVAEQGLVQISDDAVLAKLAAEVIVENEKSAADYRGGKEKALQALVGQMMRKTRGKGNPGRMRELLLEALQQ